MEYANFQTMEAISEHGEVLLDLGGTDKRAVVHCQSASRRLSSPSDGCSRVVSNVTFLTASTAADD